MDTVQLVMPMYTYLKGTWAIKIKNIEHDTTISGGPNKATLVSEYGMCLVSAEYMTKHKPQVGGYFIIYEDGYQSFLPADAFESGYKLIR